MANEKRLIDANALRRHMEKAFELCGLNFITKNDVLYCIDNSDTVDAVPVPCKIGDEVWGLMKCRYRTSPAKGVVHHMYFGEDMRLCICVRNVCRGEWGKNVFATKEEAEAALAKMNGGNEGE